MVLIKTFSYIKWNKNKKKYSWKIQKVHITGDSRSAIKQFHNFLVFFSFSRDWASRFGAQFIILALIYRIFLFFLLTSREFFFPLD